LKKIFLLPLLLLSPLYALPIGNPMDASLFRSGLFSGGCEEPKSSEPCFNLWNLWNLRLGFYGDYVFNRHMELERRDRADIDDFEIFTNAGFFAINICNRLDLFTTVGATNIYLSANPKVFGGDPETKLELSTESHFSWSVGGRLTIWNCECWYFGFEGQYFYTKPDVKHIFSEDLNVYP
jgi:major outer membrane protein